MYPSLQKTFLRETLRLILALLTYLFIAITDGTSNFCPTERTKASFLTSTSVALPRNTIVKASCHEITCIGRYELSNFNTLQLFKIAPKNSLSELPLLIIQCNRLHSFYCLGCISTSSLRSLDVLPSNALDVH